MDKKLSRRSFVFGFIGGVASIVSIKYFREFKVFKDKSEDLSLHRVPDDFRNLILGSTFHDSSSSVLESRYQDRILWISESLSPVLKEIKDSEK